MLDVFDAQSSGGPQEVSILSALDGSAPSVFTGDNPDSDRFGYSVARVGEAGGDENDSDFVVGAPEYLRDWDGENIVETHSGPGYAKVFLGPNSASSVVAGDDDGSRFGFSVGGEIDLNDDPEGHDEVLIGAPLWDLEDGGQTLQENVGRVYALDVGEGTYLHSEPLIGAYEGEQFGQYVKGLGNVVGGSADQTEDFVVGAWKTTIPTTTDSVCTCPTNPDIGGRIAGRALVFNGLSLSQELEYWGEHGRDSAGTPTVLLDGAGPAGDDVLAVSGLRWGNDLTGVPEQGRVYLFRLFP